MPLADNPSFTPIEIGSHIFYVPTQHTDYHQSRFMKMNEYLLMSGSGLTSEVLEAHIDKLIQLANDATVKTLRTDIGSICNALKYRIKNPVDEKAAIKIGAVLVFMNEEDPNKFTQYYQDKKMQLADKDPDVFAFFLHTGIEQYPKSKVPSDILTNLGYFNNRREMLKTLYSPLGIE